MSSDRLVCVICDYVSRSIKDLREHTRQHGSKEKRYSKNKEYTGKQPTKFQTPCDICTEVFDTPTKAIVHKFRRHPNSVNTYFCSWCGQQFPIIHILEKHKTSHKEPEPEKVIPCEHCDAFFFNVKAAMYHVNYYHKKEFMMVNYVQTAPASLKIVYGGSGAAHSAYYCQYCGVQYIVKFNLRQHIRRVHMDEASLPLPENMIQCKMCGAYFYTVKAYELHTTFHSESDVIVASEEMRQQLVSSVDQDFDMRRVVLFQDRQRPTSSSLQSKTMSNISEYRERMFSDIGNMSSLSPPPEDTDSSDEETVEDKDPLLIEEPTENAITIDEFFELNKSLLGDCVDSTGDDAGIQDLDVTRKRNRHKNKGKDNKLSRTEYNKGSKKIKKEDISVSPKTVIKKEKNSRMKDHQNGRMPTAKSSKESYPTMCRKYGLKDVKVRLERMDLEAKLKSIRNKTLAKVPCNESNLKPKTSIPIVTKLQNKSSMKVLRKISPPKDVSKLNIKLLTKTKLPLNFVPKKVNNEKSNKNPTTEILKVLSSVGSKTELGRKLKGQQNSVGKSSTGPIRLVPMTKLKDNEAVKIPKALIPVDSIPENLKDVKMFKKVLIPKGVLKPGVKVLSMKELDHLEKSGVIVMQ